MAVDGLSIFTMQVYRDRTLMLLMGNYGCKASLKPEWPEDGPAAVAEPADRKHTCCRMVELQVRASNGLQLTTRCVVLMTGLTWCLWQAKRQESQRN